MDGAAAWPHHARMPADPTAPPEPSLDEQLKRLQLAKLQHEIRNLSGWGFDSISKVVVASLAVALAAWTFYIGLPKAQSDLAKAQVDLAGSTSRLDAAKKELEAAKAEFEQARRDVEQARLEVADLRKTSDEFKLTISQYRSTLAQVQQADRSASYLPAETRAAVNQAVRPPVYVQFAGSVQRAFIDGLRESLKEGGFNAPAAERINRGQSNEVRYFSDTPADKERAESVARLVDIYLEGNNCKSAPLRARLVPGKPSPIEVWLMLSCG